MMKKKVSIVFISIVLTLLSCSAFKENEFFDEFAGSYVLTLNGSLFLIRELGSYLTAPPFMGQEIELRADGSIHLVLTPAPSLTTIPIAQFQKGVLSDQAIYQLLGTNTFVAVSKSERLLISTTNGMPSVDSVLFEHLIPIAGEKDE